MAYLLVTSGPSAGTSFDLKQCPLSVGRDVTRDVQLLDMQVSRKHFTVDRTKDGRPSRRRNRAEFPTHCLEVQVLFQP